MKALSLFTGAGGADLGITEAGIEVVRGVEWEAPAVATCHAAGLDYVRHGDVRDLELYEGLPPIDLLFGGPPCQAFSSAGNRQGQDDLDRNAWPWTLEVIDHVKPRWALLENVLGLLHHSKDCAPPCPGCYWTGELLPAFRARFPWVEHRVLNASSYGVPQHRRRVFLVCGPGPIRWPEATHGDPATFGQADLFGRRRKPWTEAFFLTGPSPAVLASEVKGARHQDFDPDRTPMRASDALWRATGRRRLTVEECARLQDFPPGHPFQGTKGDRYKQVGNAWPRAFGRVLGRALLEAEERL